MSRDGRLTTLTNSIMLRRSSLPMEPMSVRSTTVRK